MRYLDFLINIVGRENNYRHLLQHLYEIEFYSLVPNDENRGLDGEHFRELFLNEVEPQGSSHLPDRPCSMLEMMIGVAYRLEWDLEGSRYGRPAREWFWVLIDNLGLGYYSDVTYDSPMIDAEFEVGEKIENLLERRYSTNGEGGLFPLRAPTKDQRRVEIWYQMSAWVIENYPI